MSIKQISIFVENKPGRLAEITEVLSGNSIDIRALSIADTADYGILRLIVNKPEVAAQALKAAGMTASITDVLAVCIPDVPGGFSKVVKQLSDSGISIEYAYAFITPKVGAAYIIVRVEDNEAATKVLDEAGIKVIDQKDLFGI